MTTPNPNLVKQIANYLRTPPKQGPVAPEPRLSDKVAAALRSIRVKTGRTTAKGALPQILWRQSQAPTNPTEWTAAEVEKFLRLVERTDDLTGNCC